jgi:hypothetical protein
MVAAGSSGTVQANPAAGNSGAALGGRTFVLYCAIFFSILVPF